MKLFRSLDPSPVSRTRLALLAAALATLLVSSSGPISAFSSERSALVLRANGETIPYRVFALFVLPDQTLHLAVKPTSRELIVTTPAGAAQAQPSGRGRWTWKAPSSPGLAVITVSDASGQERETVTLNVFVMVPAAAVRDESLNGYRIGAYPTTPFRGLAAYRPPRGFVEVTESNRHTQLSPHFTLDQFLCKQVGDFPKYVVLRERLLLKLEYLLQLVNEKGHSAQTFAILSGYRTPFYNRAIGNGRYSRHVWGGAADVFIDEAPKDGWMDDLNRDGRVDLEDARLLYRLFERSSVSPEHRELVGGLGVYDTTPAHGPFVHVDARGYRARWGKR